MAILTSLTVNDTGYIQLPTGISSTTVEKKVLGTLNSYDATSIAVSTDRIFIGDKTNNKLYGFDQNGGQLFVINGSGSFGSSIGIGTTFMIVGSETSSTSGSASMYDFDGNFIRTFTPSSATSGARFGCSCAVGTDRIIIGAYLDNNEGSAFLYNFSGTEIAKLNPSDVITSDQFGLSVGAGSTTVSVGANAHNSNALTDNGSVYIFNTSGTQINKISGDRNYGRFGYSLAMNSQKIIIGGVYSRYFSVADSSGNNLTKVYLNNPDTFVGSNGYLSVGISSSYIACLSKSTDNTNPVIPGSWTVEIFDYNGNSITGFTLNNDASKLGGQGISILNNKVIYRSDSYLNPSNILCDNAFILTIPETGMIRYNEDFDILELYNDKKWSSFSNTFTKTIPLFYDENLFLLLDFSQKNYCYIGNIVYNLSPKFGTSQASIINFPYIDTEDSHSLVLNGTNQYIQVNHNSLYNSSEITLFAWVKLTDNGSYQYIFSKDESDFTNGSFKFGVSSGFITFFLTGSNGLQAAGSFSFEKWVFLCHVKSPYDYKLLIDDRDRLLSSYTSSNYAPNNTEPLYIGALNTTSGYLNGKIGMVGMYNRKLSIEEMRTLYHSTKRRFGM